MTIAKQIRQEIEQQLIDVRNIEIPKAETLEISPVYDKLKRYGIRSKEVVSLQTWENNNIAIESEKRYINYLNTLSLDPRWKIIDFKTLWGVMQKWDLYMGSLSKYTQELPLKNAEELWEYLELNNKSYTSRRSKILGNLETQPYTSAVLSNNNIVYSGMLEAKHLLIIAPAQDFTKTEDKCCINRQIFYDKSLKLNPTFKAIPSPDPIIVRPLIDINGKYIFDIVTAWGREAGDVDIVNEKNN